MKSMQIKINHRTINLWSYSLIVVFIEDSIERSIQISLINKTCMGMEHLLKSQHLRLKFFSKIFKWHRKIYFFHYFCVQLFKKKIPKKQLYLSVVRTVQSKLLIGYDKFITWKIYTCRVGTSFLIFLWNLAPA